MIRRSTHLFIIACEHLTECFYDGKLVSATDISQKYNMNYRALRPALVTLTRSGVLQSQTGGKEPGYKFTRDPREISLYEIMLHLEGPTENICCMDMIRGLKCSCKNKSDCVFYKANMKIIADSKELFSKIPLTELFSHKD